MPEFTPAQRIAIETRNKTLLLSAAAGSGKTTTLTQRIISSITEENADISKMLIVTFTRASANDLKTKITAAINNALANDPSNKHLSSQLIKLGSAKISTIDSFYLNAVKQNFSVLGLSSSFRIADETETVLIAEETARGVVSDFFDNDSDFPTLCECFENIRDTDDGMIAQLLIDIYTRKCRTVPEGVEYIKMCAEAASVGSDEDFFNTSFGNIVHDYSLSVFKAFFNEYDKIIDVYMAKDEKLLAGYGSSFEDDRAFCLKIVNGLEKKTSDGSYATISKMIREHKFPPIGSLSGKFASDTSEYCKKFRDDFKNTVESLKKEYFCFSPDDFSVFFTETSKLLSTLYRVVAEFERRYMEQKAQRNILELADVKRYAYKLFVTPEKTPTELAKLTAQQYSDIYIDEYQDVDPVQDLIFSCICTPTNRFMVGDIKQSIYRFRDAKPQLFADYRAKFPAHGTPEAENSSCETIFMSENFRCTENIIDFTNLICSDIFRACKGSIGYTDADDLVYPEAKKKEPEKNPQGPKVNVAFFAKPKQRMPDMTDDGRLIPSPTQAEAEFVAQTIHDLILNGKRLNGERIKPCDIAVIYKAHSASTAITDALAQYGIQTSNSDASQYFKNPDVVMTLSILNAVDNPQRDVHLAGALRSPIFGFSLEELMLINGYGDKSYSLYDKLCECSSSDTLLGEKCRDFCNTLEEWRCISASMPIDKFLRRIFSSDRFVASGLVSDKDELGEGGNLQTLYEYARTFEAGSFKGLYNFIEFINTLIENGATLKVRKDDGSDNCVKLSTIHSSKGLEYPICFVIGAAGKFPCLRESDNYAFEYGVGMAMSIPDKTGFARYKSPLKGIIDLYSRIRGIEEEMRVLYVALTRAKEQLFVTGAYSLSLINTATASAKYNANFWGDHTILHATSFFDWILPVFFKYTDVPCAELHMYATDALPQDNLNVSTCEQLEEGYNTELYEFMKKSFSFEYPYKSLRRIPAKISVSKLSPDVLDESDTSLSIFDNEKNMKIPEFFTGEAKRTSASERGTATHNFLQFCDFAYMAENGVEKTVDMLIEKGFIPSSYADMLYIDELKAFINTEFFSQILSAKKIIREQRFNILLPCENFTEDIELRKAIGNETIAVQGVIDLILIDEDDNILLFDYKTDRLNNSELNNDAWASKKMNDLHGLQLSYYSEAVKQLFGKSPERVAVYSTHAAKLFDINIKSLKLSADIL